MIEAPKELRISRSVEDVDGKKYYIATGCYEYTLHSHLIGFFMPSFS